MEGYYNNLLNPESDIGNSKVSDVVPLNDADNGSKKPHDSVPEKWKGQIEKVVYCHEFLNSSFQSLSCWEIFKSDCDIVHEMIISIFVSFIGFA